MKYPKIPHIETEFRKVQELIKGECYIEEKIDGSNFRFWRKGDEIYCGSRGVPYGDIFNPIPEYDKRFTKIIQVLRDKHDLLLDVIKEGQVLFGEYLETETHGQIKYSRVPKDHLYLFDVFEDDKWWKPENVIKLAEKLEFEPVKIYEKRKINDIKEPKTIFENEYKNTESILGGAKIEGIVVKNYNNQFLHDNIVLIPMVKYVRPEFQETLRNTIKDENSVVITERYIKRLMNYNRFLKIINRLEEEGKEVNPTNIFELYTLDLIEEGEFDKVMKDLEQRFIEKWNRMGLKAMIGMYNGYITKKAKENL